MDNQYIGNLYTGGKSLIHMDGAPRIIFDGETFTDNGDMSSEGITAFGSGILSAAITPIIEMSITAAIGSPESYSSSTLGQSLITVKRSISFSMVDMTFTNNWKLETDYGTRS